MGKRPNSGSNRNKNGDSKNGDDVNPRNVSTPQPSLNSDSRRQEQNLDQRSGRIDLNSTTASKLTCTNHSVDKICIEAFNNNFITGGYLPISKRNSQITLTIFPQTDRLVLHSVCFARKILSIKNVYFKQVLDGAYPSAWEQQLSQLFIYSYFQNLYSILWRSEKNMIGSKSYGVIGHNIMASAAVNPVHQFTFDDNFVTFYIEFDDADVTAIENCAKQFQWLVPHIRSRNGEKFIYCPILSRQLAMLSDSLRGVENAPILEEFTPGSFDSLEGNQKYLTLENFAIGNSFYNNASDKSNFLYVSGSSRLTHDSMLFGKGLFFTLKGEMRDFPSQNVYFKQVVADSGALLRYELEAISGCTYMNIDSTIELKPYLLKHDFKGRTIGNVTPRPQGDSTFPS